MPVDGGRINRLDFTRGASLALAETVASVGSYNLIDQENVFVWFRN